MKHFYLLCLVNCALCAALFSGCGSAKKETAISGSITVDGKPVGTGYIQFIPVGGGFDGGGSIADGKYKAVVPFGEMTVRMRGFEKSTVEKVYDTATIGQQQSEAKVMIPEKYWDNSDLRVTIDGSGKPVDFTLSSK